MVSSWQGRRVLVTGHTGFKGSWLTLWLAKLGAQVCGYSLDPNTQPNMFTEADVASAIEDVRGDVRDYKKLLMVMSDFNPEVVFHLAAQPLVLRSYSDPLETYTTNVIGTASMLEAVRQTRGVRAVVCITTDKCYENKEWMWPYRETDALGGHDPYSSSKACAELVTAAYRSSFFAAASLHENKVAVATARAGNVIGGGDWSEHRLIPDLIRGFKAGTPVRIRRPDSIRPWQHVLEPLQGYLSLAEHLFSGEPSFASAYNFGPKDDDTWPVERIVAKSAELWGHGATWVRESNPAAHEASYLKLDSSKAREQLRWRPRLNLESALEWTLAWYKASLQSEDMQRFTVQQITEYERLQKQDDHSGTQ